VLFKRIFSAEGNKLSYKVLIAASLILALVYLISPYDLIPDYIGLLGYLDDAFVLLAVLWAVVAMLEMYRTTLLDHVGRRV